LPALARSSEFRVLADSHYTHTKKMGCTNSVDAKSVEAVPEAVAFFFNGEPMAGKAEKMMGEHYADSHVLSFIGPNAPPVPPLDKEHLQGAMGNLIGSFPDLTFNFTKVPVKKAADGGWAADIIVMGTHTGAAFTPMPGKLPAIDKTDKCVKIGEETFTLYVDEAGKVVKTTIEPLHAGKPAGPPGFYTEVGGVLPGAPAPTVFASPTAAELGEPNKVMGGGDTGAAKMWLFTSQGKKMSRISIEKGFDWKKTVSPMLPGCPEWCPATHFGYLESGEMGVKMKDGTTKTIKAGESYFVPPGHLPVMEKDAVMIEFSQDETYTSMIDGKPAEKPPPPPADAVCFCQPCEGELGEPTKVMGEGMAQMWITKESGQQMMRVAIKKGFDWKATISPILPGCPEWCPATHFGYLESGEMGVKMKDGSSYTVKAGTSYLIPPGHLPVMEKDAVMVEFSQDPTYTSKEVMDKLK